jgi:hypothetical protein
MPMTAVLSDARPSASQGFGTSAKLTANGMCASEAHTTTRWLASAMPRLASRSASQPPNISPAGASTSSSQPW